MHCMIYNMNIVQNYIEVLKKYAVFTGRATRAEYWNFFVATFIVSIVVNIIESMLGLGRFLGFVYSLATLLPSLGVGIRRLHDSGRSGWWTLLVLIPVIGWIILLIFLVADSTADNEYGPNPKGSSTPAAPMPIPEAPVQ
jgi:uncharacterized membrane protein YhaH (DUF805 family)